jgi:transcription initiation factor TFIID subunit 8
MLHFLKSVTSSMHGSRREAPTPEDFAAALARSNLTSSSLTPFLAIPSNPSICQPEIPPLPGLDKAGGRLDLTLDSILQYPTEEVQKRQKHVPKHFPGLPSKHTWKATEVFQTREQDARKLRERATQEGVMAEQALRRLMEASKVGQREKSTTKDSCLVPRGRSARSWDHALEAIERHDGEEEAREMRIEKEMFFIPPAMGAMVTKVAPNETFESAAVVNCGRLNWREMARGKS